jgi:hypothetical protein
MLHLLAGIMAWAVLGDLAIIFDCHGYIGETRSAYRILAGKIEAWKDGQAGLRKKSPV